MAGIFVCYSRADRALAQRVVDGLRGLEVEVLWDQDLENVDWLSELERQAARLAAFLVLWTPSSLGSYPLRDEARLAMSQRKLINVVSGVEQAPFPYDRLKPASLEEWTGSPSHPGWVELVARVDEHLASGGASAPGVVTGRLQLRRQLETMRLTAEADAELSLREAKAAADAAERAFVEASRGLETAKAMLERVAEFHGGPALQAAAQADFDAARAAIDRARKGRNEANANLAAADRILAGRRQEVDDMSGLAAQSTSAPTSEPQPRLKTDPGSAPTPPSQSPASPEAAPATLADGPRIVISYRRADSRAITGRIVDRLIERYGRGSVFMDVDSIPIGVKYRTYIEQFVLAHADVVLAFIGRKWAGPRRGRPPRIAEPDDLVRIEVETALRNGLPLVPVLVDGGSLPPRTALPESLLELRNYNAAEVVSDRDFHPNVDRLISAIDDLLAQPRQAAPTPHPR